MAIKTCPKCGSDKVLNGSCLDCGIIIEKFLQLQDREAPPAAVEVEEQAVEAPSLKKFYIILGLVVVGGIIIMRLFAGRYDIDLGGEKPVSFSALTENSGGAFAEKLLRIGAVGWGDQVDDQAEIDFDRFEIPDSLRYPAASTEQGAYGARPEENPAPEEPADPNLFEIEGGSITLEQEPTPVTDPATRTDAGEFDGSGGQMLKARDYLEYNWIGQKNLIAEHTGELLVEKSLLKITELFELRPRYKLGVIFDGETRFAGLFQPPEGPAPPDGKIRVPLASEKVDLNLFGRYVDREVAIALLVDQKEQAPAWFVQGVGMYVSRDARFTDQLKQSGIPFHKYPGLTEISNNYERFAGADAYIALGVSLLLVDYLINTYGEISLKELIGKLASGISFERAFNDVYYQNLQEFEQRWYARQR